MMYLTEFCTIIFDYKSMKSLKRNHSENIKQLQIITTINFLYYLIQSEITIRISFDEFSKV